MSFLSQFLTTPYAQPTAGAAVAYQNLVQIGADGLAYPCAVSDYAAVGAAGTLILPAATIGSFGFVPTANSGFPSCVGADGSVYVLVNGSGSGGSCAIAKFSPAGQLLGITSAGLTLGTTINTGMVGLLSNGNIFCVASGTGAGGSNGTSFAIITPGLAVVTSAVAVANNSNTVAINASAVAMAGGGFAIACSIVAGTVQLAIYDNNGTNLSATSAIMGGSTPGFSVAVAQLSNGNLIMTAGAGDAALHYAIYTTGGVIVGTQVTSGVSHHDPNTVSISVLPGFFAITTPDVSNQYHLEVYSNVAVLQGSTYTAPIAGAAAGFLGLNVLVNDGAAFWLVYSVTGGSLTKITTGGIATVYNTGNGFSASYTHFSCAYDGLGNIVICASFAANGAQYIAFNTVLGTGLSGPTAIAGTFTTVPTVAVSLGDGVFMFYGGTGGACYGTILKAVGTAILGSAAVAAAQGTVFPVNNGPGTCTITQLKGSVFKGFASTANGGGYINGTVVAQRGAGASRSID